MSKKEGFDVVSSEQKDCLKVETRNIRGNSNFPSCRHVVTSQRSLDICFILVELSSDTSLKTHIPVRLFI